MAAIPVLIFSALMDLDTKLKGFAMGAVDFITKPIDEAELLARVGVHLNLRHVRRRGGDVILRYGVSPKSVRDSDG